MSRRIVVIFTEDFIPAPSSASVYIFITFYIYTVKTAGEVEKSSKSTPLPLSFILSQRGEGWVRGTFRPS